MARLFDQVLPVSQISLQPASSFPELYQELWWYSGSYATNTTTSSNYRLQKGSISTTLATNPIGPIELFTLNSNWPANTKCALEAAIWTSSSSSTCTAQLYDVTAGALVGSTISTTSTTATVVRSAQFTLTPGHQYGVAVWESTTSTTAYITDASLIVFPPSPLTSPSVSAISLANPSSGNTLKEAYIPLWVYSSGATSVNGASAYYLAQKGTTSPTIVNTITSASKLYTLTSSWSASQKFAFECSLYTNNASYTASAALYDLTSGTASQISGSLVSTTSTTATLLRSGSFTLTPGHTYGVGFYEQTGYVYLTKAHLVALA